MRSVVRDLQKVVYFDLARRSAMQLKVCLCFLAIYTTYLARAFHGWCIHGHLYFRFWKDQFDLKLPETDHPNLDLATVGHTAE